MNYQDIYESVDLGAAILSPYTSVVLTIFGVAVAVSGKFNMNAARLFLFIAWLISIFAMRQLPLLALIPLAACSAVLMLLVAYLLRPALAPEFTGRLIPFRKTLMGTGAVGRDIEIGNSGAVFRYFGPDGTPAFNFFDRPLMVEVIGGKLYVSTTLTDRSGNMIAEIYRNEWRVSDSANVWDMNYNKRALEVRSKNGRVVLQIEMMPDRCRFQGEWWEHPGNGIIFASEGYRKGALMYRINANSRYEDAPTIQPIFIYPAKANFGKMRDRPEHTYAPLIRDPSP